MGTRQLSGASAKAGSRVLSASSQLPWARFGPLIHPARRDGSVTDSGILSSDFQILLVGPRLPYRRQLRHVSPCMRLVVQALCRWAGRSARCLGRCALAGRYSRRSEHPTTYAPRLVDELAERRRVKVGSHGGDERRRARITSEGHVRSWPVVALLMWAGWTAPSGRGSGRVEWFRKRGGRAKLFLVGP